VVESEGAVSVVIEPLIHVETTRIGEQTVVVATGEIDLASAGKLQAAIAELSGQVVTVDLRGVEFIDSTGLAMLIKEHDRVGESGGELRLVVQEKGPVVRLFELTGLAQSFQLSNSL
jgi:anti-anti-sigma factor